MTAYLFTTRQMCDAVDMQSSTLDDESTMIHIPYALKFCGTKLSQIANMLNIRRFYFRGCWERIDMVDHLVSGNFITNWYLIKRRPYLYFLSNIKASTEQGHCLAFIFLQFCNTCSKYSQIKLSTDGFPNCENHKSFVLQIFKGIR